MKNIYLSLCVTVFTFWGHAQCPYNNILDTTIAAPTTVGSSVVVNTMMAGDMMRITNMQRGYLYKISTCPGNSFDTELSLYSQGGGQLWGYNDDANSSNCSEITFSPAYSGNYDLLLDRVFVFHCLGNTTPTSISVTLVSTPANVITIPVVFHVVYNSPADSISYDQISSQLDVIKADFRRLNSNFQNTYSPFLGTSDDPHFDFCMAQRDPQGNPSQGITYTHTNKNVFSITQNDVKKSNTGGKDGWNPNQYLNIWVCQSLDSAVAYAQYPWINNPQYDGIVVSNFAFGTLSYTPNIAPNGHTNPFRNGHTLTHEIGHWLGLIHIWGDDEKLPNRCSGTDYVNDTPNQDTATRYNQNITGQKLDDCTTVSPGIMYNNYMNYIKDSYMSMFSVGQCARMRYYFNNLRNSISGSNGCTPPPTNCPSGATCLTNNTSVNVCSGTFYDAGGTGNYFNNQSFTKTFNPSTTGKKLKFEFTTFNTEHNKDILTLYDGATINSPLIGVYSGNLAPFSVEATNPTGSITAKWISDNANTNIGWVANISCVSNEFVIPPGNYKSIFLAGLNLNQQSNELEFLLQGVPAQNGDVPVNIADECAKIKKRFKQALAIPEGHQWISLNIVAGQNGYPTGDATSDPVFENTDLAKDFFEADVKLKFGPTFRNIAGLTPYNGMKTVFNNLVYQGPYLSELQAQQYAFYPGWRVRAGIHSKNLNYSSQGANKIIINNALMEMHQGVDYVKMGGDIFPTLPSHLQQTLNSKLPAFKNTLAQRLDAGVNLTGNLVNTNGADYERIRSTYRITAGAKWYKTLTNTNKPFQNLINSNNLTGITVSPPYNDTYWNGQAYQPLNMSELVAIYTNQLVVQCSYHGGLSFGNYNLIDTGAFNNKQVNIDTTCFKNRSYVTVDSFVYFFGGILDYKIADLLGTMQLPIGNHIVGDTVQINATIFNFGNNNAQQFPVRLYEQYTNAQNQQQTILISQQTISNIDSFSIQSISFTWIPQTYGGKKLILTIDEGNQVIEKKETNNIAYDSLFIQNNTPSVTITSPFNGSAISNMNITLSGTAYDPRDGYLNYNNLSWTSNIDGFLGNGSFLHLDSLSIGNHSITFSGTNSHGQTAFAYINLYLFPQGYPVAIIFSPLNNATLPNNSPVFFSGEASDLDDGSLCNAATWSSSIDGTLGTGCNLNHTLSLGNHTITYTVTNSANHTSTATINVSVVNGLPSVSIVQPLSSASFYQHQSVTLQASATDFPQGNISNLVKWYSDIQGYLGAGQSLSVLLSPGNHILTASVQDNAGSIATATVPVIIKYTPPVPIIIQPVSNQTLNYHDTLTFIGHATDIQDGALHGTNLRWYSTLNGFLGFGDTLKIASLTYGAHTISLKAVDSNGADSTVKALNIYIDAGQPTCVITQPANGANFFFANSITLSGTATDPQNGTLTGNSLKWYSDADGLLGSGNSISVNSLSAGNQTITLTATDNDGFIGSTTVSFYVEPPHPPVVSIYYPFNNNHFVNGSTVTLKASAYDYEEGVLNNNRVTWSSSINGSLGTGKTIPVSNLSPGTHIISATAIDTTALTTTASIQIIIDQQKPVAQITSPVSGSIFSQGTNVVFTGTATDYEDGILTGNSLQWFSDVNGNLGSGNSVNTSSLSVGSHLIKLIATDSQNAKDTAFVILRIQAPNTLLLSQFYNGVDTFAYQFPSNGGDAITYISLPSHAKALNSQVTIYGQPVAISNIGSLDLSFIPGTGVSSINSIAIQNDGKIIIGGVFTSYDGTPRNRIARINTNGSLDLTFNPGTGADNDVYVVYLQSDGKIIIGGTFTSYNGITRNNLARLNSDGSLDTGFNTGTGPNTFVVATSVQPDGKIIIGGGFTSFNGVGTNSIARLNIDGSLDASFNSGAGVNGTINAACIQTDGKIVISGDFTTYQGIARNRVARINANGTIDNTFLPGSGANNYVLVTSLQLDGKITLGGGFTSYAGASRNYIARINSDGSLDNSFSPGSGTNSQIESIALQDDGKLLMGGGFTSYNTVARNRIVRANVNGSLDSTFNIGSGTNGIVYSIAVQNDRKILIGGTFSSYNGIARNGIARILNDSTFRYPFNPYIDCGNNSTFEWTFSGSYQSTQNTTNFSTEINNYLSTHIGNPQVLIPIKIHSDSVGILKLKFLNIQYQITDTISPSFVNAKLVPTSLAQNSSFAVRVKVSDNEKIDSVKAIFKNTTYNLTQVSTDSFQVTILADTVGYFPVTITVSDTNGLTHDTVLYVTVYSTTRDLEVLSSNISITPATIFTNDSVHFTCIVKNNSNLTITNAQVALIIDGVTQQTKTVTLNSLTQAQLNFDWVAKWGQHIIVIKADPNNLIAEANENNNTGTQYITVNDIYAPVILQATATPNPAFIGNSVFFKVKAIDSTGIASVTINWQSQNVTLTYNSLTAFYEGYVNANIAGTSNAIVTAYDVNGLSSSTGISIQVLQNLADLKVYSSDILFVPALSGSGNTASIQIKVRNSGSINANNANVILRADGVNIGSQSATVLHDSSLVFTFTWQVNCGSHTFSVVLDSANVIAETNETNNTASVVHQFCAIVPSYILNAQAIPTVISLGSSTNIQLTSVPSVTNAIVSTIWNSQATAMPFNSLNNNYSVQIVPAQTGIYTLPVLFTDVNGFQTATVVQFTVVDSLPDLSVNSISTTYPVQPNSNTQFSVSVSNNSLQTIPNTFVQLLVDNQVVDSIQVAVMNPFDSITVQLNWLPTAGTHQVTAFIDYHNVIAENNEANNSKTIQLNIQDNQPPVIHFINTTTPIYHGGNTQVSSYVTDNDSVVAVVANFMGSNYPMLYDSVSGTWKVTLNITSSGTFPLIITATDNSSLSSSATISVLVNSNVPDLEIKAQNIIATHVDSITNTVTAIIQNVGGGIANNVKIHFAINGILMDSVLRNFTAGQADTVMLTFNYPVGFYTVTITIDPYNAVAESNENNNSASRKIFIPDLTAPPSPVVTVVPSGWSASPNFTVSWNQVFDNSGTVTYEYSVNGSVWTNVGTNLSAIVTATLEGLSYVYVRAKDAFGNVSQPGIGEMKYDNTAPNAPLIAEYHCGSSWTIHESPYLEWLNPGDIGSGIEHFEVSIDNASPLNIGFNFNHHPVLTSGVHTLKVRAVDYVNHIGNWSNVVTVYIDLDNPACPNIVSPTHPNQNVWYQNDSVVLNWNHPTETSSVTGFFYALSTDSSFYADQSSYWLNKDILTITKIASMDTTEFRIPDGVWYVHISSQDTVGHLSSSSCSYRFMLDKTPPFTTANNIDTVSGCAYSFSLHSEDYYSGVANTYYRVNNGTWHNDTVVSLNQGGMNTIQFYSTDIAGNQEQYHSVNVFLTEGGSITTYNDSICQGQPYNFGGTLLYQSGTYTDTLRAHNNCDSIVTLSLYVDPCLSIDENVSNMLVSIFPNPNNGTFIVHLKSDDINQVEISCLTLVGQSIYSKDYSLLNGELKTELNLSPVAKGLYLIRITANGKSVYRKVTIAE